MSISNATYSLFNEPLLDLNPHAPPDTPNDLPPNIDPPLPATIQIRSAACTDRSARDAPADPHEQPQAGQRRDRHAHVPIHARLPVLGPAGPLQPRGDVDGDHALEHEDAGAEQLARDAAMLRPPAAIRRRRSRDAAAATAAAPPPPRTAGVPGAEEQVVVARRVVRGEVRGDEEVAGRGREKGREVRALIPLLLRCRCRRRCLRGGGVAGRRGPLDSGLQHALVLEVGPRGDQELAELSRPVGPCRDGRREARPERGAGVLEAREGVRCGAGEGVVDGGAEARPEVGCVLLSRVGEGGRRRAREDGDVLRLRVRGEVDVWRGGYSQERRGGHRDDEDSSEVRDLRWRKARSA